MADKSIAETLVKSVEKIFAKSNQIQIQGEPEIIERDIIEYDSRMRAYGMEKFNDACYISVIELYASQEQLESKDAHGAIILYVREDAADRLYRALDYRDFNETNEESMMDTCAEMMTNIAKQFVNDARSKGYSSLFTGTALKYMNKVDEGVRFNYDEKKFFEISFEIFKEKIVCLDITLSAA